MEREPRSEEPTEAAAADDQPVTVSISRRVKPGREQDYEQLIQTYLRRAEAEPGYVEARLFRPTRGKDRYRAVLRFENQRGLRDWQDSELRRQLLADLEDLTEDEPWISDITGTTQDSALVLALTPLDAFVRTSVSGVGLLIAGTLAAIVLANTPLSAGYEAFWNTYFTVGAADFGLTLSLRHWVNDFLMAFFFFIVGLEIKREVLVGEMRYPRQAALAISAAAGGVIVPALVFAGLNWGGAGLQGWGIPIGTDTAFALALLSLLGTRVRPILLVFMTAFAIIDDILAVGVIAVFYTDRIAWGALGLAALLLVILIFFNVAGLHRWYYFAILGLAVWVAVFASGVHGTLAGVLVAMTVPARSWINPSEFLTRSRRLIDEFENACYIAPTILTNEPQQRVTLSLSRLIEQAETPLTYLEHRLNPWVSYGIVPVFAFANAGIPLVSGLGDALTSSVSWGVVLGLVIGKPLGIVLFPWVAARLGIATLPRAMAWRHVLGVGFVGGIGFTISLFITELAFGDGEQANLARVGIFFGSLIAGTIGFVLLRATLPPPRAEEAA